MKNETKRRCYDTMKKAIQINLSVLLLLLCFLTVFSGCSKKDGGEKITTAVETTKAPYKEPTDYNRLTGLDDLSEEAKGKRPVAIMINNIKASLPQYGISGADLMFECLVEGGITRMMAVYADYTKVPTVCSVRSCRYYFPIFAQGLDAVYFCFGSNPTLGTPTLKKLKIDYFNGAEKYDELIFGRDPNRLGAYSREHTGIVKGKNIPALYQKYNIRADYKEGKDRYIFKFRNSEKTAAVSKKECKKLTLNFSRSYYSTFTYDAATKKYLKQHSGKPHMDTASGKQLSYTNVFVLETTVKLYGNGPLVQINWKGGTGYYISGGTVKAITWTKKNANSAIIIKDADGKRVTVNKGNSYIGVVNKGETAFTA